MSGQRPVFYGLLLALGVLSLFAALEPRWPGELWAVQRVQALRGDLLDTLMARFSQLGELRVAAASVAGLGAALAILRMPREALLVLTTPVWDALTTVLKGVVDRPRPSGDLGVIISKQYVNSSSFPSGHVVHATVLFGVVFYLVTIHVKRPWLRLALQSLLAITIVTVGVSRVYRGAHWPSDVVGGYVFAAIALWVLIWGYRRFLRRRNPQATASST